jgi:hypothetical protein
MHDPELKFRLAHWSNRLGEPSSYRYKGVGQVFVDDLSRYRPMGIPAAVGVESELLNNVKCDPVSQPIVEQGFS